MTVFVFAVGSISVFILFRFFLFNAEMKRWPTGYQDFMSYRMRWVSILLGSIYSLIVFFIGYPKSGHSSGFSLFLFFLLIVFLLPLLYLAHLKRKDNEK